MFFKQKKSIQKEEITEVSNESLPEESVILPEEEEKSETKASEYAFYKPDPYPKELVSVLKSMLQRLFPDTKRAYLLEAQKSDRKGYLLIVDIDSKFLKIINIYLDGETKKVRGNTPIECILYTKSGSLTEGIDPFYSKESSESKANNLASKEFSGEVVFSQMPEFELWSKSDKSNSLKFEDEISDKTTNSNQIKADAPVIIPAKKEQKQSDKTDAKVKPTTKEELFGILNEYGTKKSGEVSTVAMAAIREFEFYIPYTLGKDEDLVDIDTTLPIDEALRFKKLINPNDGLNAVPLFTEKEDALLFAKKDSCKIAKLKYKDFASSRAAELTGFDGVLINPNGEALFFLSNHPLLGEEKA